MSGRREKVHRAVEAFKKKRSEMRMSQADVSTFLWRREREQVSQMTISLFERGKLGLTCMEKWASVLQKWSEDIERFIDEEGNHPYISDRIYLKSYFRKNPRPTPRQLSELSGRLGGKWPRKRLERWFYDQRRYGGKKTANEVFWNNLSAEGEQEVTGRIIGARKPGNGGELSYLMWHSTGRREVISSSLARARFPMELIAFFEEDPFLCSACGRCFRESASLLNHAATSICGKHLGPRDLQGLTGIPFSPTRPPRQVQTLN